jgi:hypothetical protein
VDKIDLSYSKTLIMIVELLRDIEHDLTKLREDYKKLYKNSKGFTLRFEIC